MIKKLFDLEPKEVSLVDKGANKKKFLVFKEDKGSSMSDKALLESIKNVDPKVMAKVETVVKRMKVVKIKKADGDMMPGKDSAVYKETHNVMADGESDRGAEMLDPHAQAALKAMARIAAPHKDKITQEHIMNCMKEAGIGNAEKPMGEQENHDGLMQKNLAIPQDVKEEHHVEALKSADKMYKSHLAKMGYRKYSDPSLEDANGVTKSKNKDLDEDDEEDGGDVEKSAIEKMLKTVPEEQRPSIEAIFKAQQELVEKNMSLEKELKVERDARVEKEFQEKASQYKNVAGDKAELVAVMKAMDTETLAKFEKILKANDAQINEGKLFAEIGSKLSHTPAGGAEAKLDALVQSYVSKSDGKESEAQVYDRVIKTPEGRALYNEFKSNRKGGI